MITRSRVNESMEMLLRKFLRIRNPTTTPRVHVCAGYFYPGLKRDRNYHTIKRLLLRAEARFFDNKQPER